MSTPGGLLACFDLGNLRISMFSDRGRYLETIRLPFFAVPAEDLATDSALALVQPSGSMPKMRIAWISPTSDSLVRDQVFKFPRRLLDSDTVVLTGAVRLPSGNLVFRAGPNHLAWFDPNGDLVDVAAIPEFGPAYPTKRDVDRWVTLHRIMGQNLTAAEIEDFRNREIGRTNGTVNQIMEVSEGGRVWVRTTRPSDQGSFVAVFRGAKYIGSFEIPGRIVNFETKGSLLVAMVESIQPDSVGLYRRHLDWYRIVNGPSRGHSTAAN